MNRNHIRLPHNLEAERALLGTMLAKGYFDNSVLLSAYDFSSEALRKIYLTMAELSDAGEAADLPTIVEALRRKGELEKTGGAAFVTGLTDGIPLNDSLDHWEKLIRRTAIRRRVMRAAEALVEQARAEDFPALTHRVECLQRLLEEPEKDESDGSLEAIEREYEQYVRNLDAFSVRFGIRELDERTGGVQLGEVATVIARTGVGKSAVVQNIIQSVLENYSEIGVAFLSLEMPRLQAFERQLQIYAGATRGTVISSYRQSHKDALGVPEFLRRFGSRFTIIDKPGMTLSEIERRVRSLVALKRLNPVRLVVIDYLGYLGGGPRNAGIVERTSELARNVKQLAKKLNAVVLLVAQTSRKAGDGSEEVTVTDARDSGAIEDSADFLIGCWRPELKAGISSHEFTDVHGDLWFRILKARRGLQDRFCVRFEGETLRVMEREGEKVTLS